MALSTVPGRMEKMGEEKQVEDEFTCPSVLRGSLLSLKPIVERVFGVFLGIGGDEASCPPQDEQIWLKLKGRKSAVDAAKLFVKGVVNQEAQKEVQFPDVLHCVFCGAKGFFIDCLVRTTSAHIVVGSLGCLLISGLAEPVVKAYSLIMDLVDRYTNSQEHVSAPGESLDSRRAFKTLVERLEDRYTLELLVLPVLVKEVLLDLVKQSELDPNHLFLVTGSAGIESPGSAGGFCHPLELQEKMNELVLRESLDNRLPKNLEGLSVPNGSSFNFSQRPPQSHLFSESRNHGFKLHGTSDQIEHPGATDNPSPFIHGDKEPRAQLEENREERPSEKWSGDQDLNGERGSQQQEENLLSAGSKQEYEHLLKFFTAMGYEEEVVCRVLMRTGPREASQVLDLIQQEKERNGLQEGSSSSATLSNLEIFNGTGRKTGTVGLNGTQGDNGEDFVLDVLKKAAASCGYTEEKVAEVYSSLPALKPHELILELQKEGAREVESRREGKEPKEPKRTEEPNEHQRKATTPQKTKKKELKEEKRNEKPDGKSGATSVEKTEKNKGAPQKEKSKKKEGAQAGERARMGAEPIIPGVFFEKDVIDWGSRKSEILSTSPKQPTFHTILPSVRGPPQPTYPSPLQPKISERQNATPVPLSTKPKHKPGSSARAKAVVTGEQRFLEGLAAPFALQLKDDPGDPGLRQIIIDGSNVAMSHGLGIFFSCRGIALAVQYFWSRGHRKITAFVPQWRQKRDPRIKEPQFMTELQDLGLLSFTPSREVQGQRINSYDDRFMLQLAQRTDGVIVTNDNMRDLVEESDVWKEIIKKRLLQYLFAADLFMVPDDPLGRGGPHINDFLRKQNSTPVPSSHSFAGVPSSINPPAFHPRAQTEVLQYRDRTPVGIGRDYGAARGQFEASNNTARSVEETMKLKQDLMQIFPGQESVIMMTLQCNPTMTDINDLSHFILEQQGDKEE